MIRAKLLQPRGERRQAHRRSGSAGLARTPPHDCDPAVARVREAGGPVDHASYSCECGYLFSASVSTTVTCPHCGTGQAW